MIGRLNGKILEKQPPYLLLDVNGVGYELEAPMSTFYNLPVDQEAVILYTHLLVREDAQILYGFSDPSERDMFRGLLKINGVGAKMALAILSGMSGAEFCHCVRNGDVKLLTRIPGIGKKTAERLIVEMKDRLDKLFGDHSGGVELTPAAKTEHRHEPVADAVEALIALGYKPPEASRMVQSIDCDGLASEEIIRLALRASMG